jgi:outer membrane lipoprotein-sorting protein
MKKIKLGLLAIAALVSAQAINAQTIDEVVTKYVDALGGKEKLASLKSARMEGALNVSGTDVALIITKLNMTGQRNDIVAMGMSGYQVYTPAAGWTYMPFMGQSSPEAMKDEEVKTGAGMLDLQGALFNYKEKGNQLELLGKENAENTDCYKVKATLKSGRVMTYFIDSKTYFIVKSVATQNVPGEEEVVNTYANYKANENGYIFPFTNTIARGEITFSKIETNVAVDEKIFTAN